MDYFASMSALSILLLTRRIILSCNILKLNRFIFYIRRADTHEGRTFDI